MTSFMTSYEPVTPEVLRLVRSGRTIEAIRLWRSLDHRLADGTPVVPSILTARDFVTFMRDVPPTLTGMTLAVSEGSYSVRAK